MQTASASRIQTRCFNQRSLSEGTASSSFLDAARADAGGAHAHVLAYTLYDALNTPQIWIPAAPTDVVRVADYVPVARLLATNLTCECHFLRCSVP